LIGAINDQLREDRFSPQQVKIVCNLIYLLCEWVMKMPYELSFGKVRNNALMFETLEKALYYSADVKSAANTQKKAGTFGIDSFRKKNAIKEETDDEDDGGGLIRQAAEYVIVHFLHHASYFPPEHGPTLLSR
jgi:hypothetical protein